MIHLPILFEVTWLCHFPICYTSTISLIHYHKKTASKPIYVYIYTYIYIYSSYLKSGWVITSTLNMECNYICPPQEQKHCSIHYRMLGAQAGSNSLRFLLRSKKIPGTYMFVSLEPHRACHHIWTWAKWPSFVNDIFKCDFTNDLFNLITFSMYYRGLHRKYFINGSGRGVVPNRW